jgi:hypothetical protein
MSVDINILGNPQQQQAALRIDGTAIYGIQKLVQRSLILLYTDIEDPLRLGVGTDLPRGDQSRNNYDIQELQTLFEIALGKVQSILLSTTSLETPADERIKEFRAGAETTDRGEVSMDITVRSQADTEFVVRVPIASISEVT